MNTSRSSEVDPHGLNFPAGRFATLSDEMLTLLNSIAYLIREVLQMLPSSGVKSCPGRGRSRFIKPIIPVSIGIANVKPPLGGMAAV
jgi:hypothetical protein